MDEKKKLRDAEFRNLDDVHAWVAADGRPPDEAAVAFDEYLLNKITVPHGKRLVLEKWLRQHRRAKTDEKERTDLELRGREVTAAERSANAAEGSEKHARSSARSARIAWFAALAMFLLEVWKFIQPRLME